MKIIVAPDKFKGSLTSLQVCNAIKRGILLADERINVQLFPMADGGDGFAEVMHYYTQTETVYCTTVDPLHRPITAAYQWNPATATAIIDMAAASGLVLLQPWERNPLQTSSYGTGLLIKDAISKGANNILLGIGGSATNDAGTGILAALGYTFTDARDNALPASGGQLLLMEKIIPPTYLPPVQFEIACDVDNVLFGPQGAAFVYAPQKGASAAQAEQLDKGLRHFAAIAAAYTSRAIATKKGMGAAGGVAAGLSVFFNTILKPGTQIVIEASGLEPAMQEADLIFTGEGKIDNQTGNGKLISHITAMANRKAIPVIALCGNLELGNEAIHSLGLHNAFPILEDNMDLAYCMEHAADLLCRKAAAIITAFRQQ